MNIVWPTNQEVETVDAIRDAIGRDVTFYIVASSIACSGCSLDPVTNTATDSFCPICGGNYWIPVYSGANINAHISWGYSEQLGWVTGGQLDEGICRVQIKWSADNENIVDNTVWATVDNREMLVQRKLLRGVQNINRILIDFIEKES